MTEADRMAETQALKKEIQRSLHCALPGTVLSFDEVSRTAEIRPAGEDLPVLKGVPVFMPVPFEVSEGDRCLVIFADRDITRWLTETRMPHCRLGCTACRTGLPSWALEVEDLEDETRGCIR